MTCVPKGTKCEWSDLKHFIAHLNAKEGSSYRRVECLDRSGSTPRPEVLCRDDSLGRELTIEQKSFVWPLDHVEHHVKEHDFWDAIQIDSDEPCTLWHGSSSSIEDQATRRKMATELSRVLSDAVRKLAAGQVASGDKPIAWMLRKEFGGEREDWEPSGGLRIERFEQPASGLTCLDDPPSDFLEALQNCLDRCAVKFADFPDARRIALLQPFPSSMVSALGTDWWARTLARLNVPEDIDEVWMCANYGAGEWEFERLHAVR